LSANHWGSSPGFGRISPYSIWISDSISVRPGPERVGIRQVRVGRRHPVDDLGRGGAAFQRRLEIGEVAAAFADLAAGVIVAGPRVAVAGDRSAASNAATVSSARAQLARESGVDPASHMCVWL
jgi:hypothetical protein